MVDRYRQLAGPDFIDPSASQFDNGGVNESRQLADIFGKFSAAAADTAGTVFAERAAKRGTADGLTGEGKPVDGFQSFTKAGQAYNNAFEASYVAKTQLDINETLTRFKQEHEGDPEGYQQKVDEYSKVLAASTPKEFQPKTQFMLRSVAVADSAHLFEQKKKTDDQENVASVLAGADASIEALGSSLEGPHADEAIGGVIAGVNASIDALVQSRAIDPVEGHTLKAHYATELHKQLAASHISGYATPLLDAVRADTVEGAKAVDKFLLRQDVPEDVKAKVIEKVDAGRSAFEAERSRKFAVQVSEIDQRIAAGEDSDSLDAQVLGAHRIAAISDSGMQSRRAAIVRNGLEHTKKDVAFNLVDGLLSAGKKLDPGSPDQVKGANQWFDRRMALVGASPGTPTYNSQAADFFKNTNILPASVTSFLRTSIISQTGDPEKDAVGAAAAVDLYRSLDKSNPNSMQYFVDQKQLSFVDQMAKQLDANTPIMAAYKTAYKNVFETTPEQEKILKQEYLKQTKVSPNLRALQGALDDRNDLEGLDGPTMFRMRAQVEGLTAAEFNTNGGDLAAAQATATRRLLGNWGTSNITGEPKVVQFPPERMYGVTTDDIERAKDKQLKAAGHYLDAPFVSLREIPRMTEESHGLSWQMVRKNVAGDESPVLDRNNRPLIFTVPVNEDYKKIYQEKVDEEVAKAATAREADAGKRERMGRITAWKLLTNPNGAEEAQLLAPGL